MQTTLPASQTDQAHFVIKTLWGSLAISQLVLVYILYTVTPPGADAVFVNDQMSIIRIFGGVAFICLMLGNFLPNLFIASAIKKFANQSNPPLSEIIAALFVPLILRFTFYEAISILGFMASFISGDWRHMMYFMIVSVPLFILSYPSESRLRKMIQGLERSIRRT